MTKSVPMKKRGQKLAVNRQICPLSGVWMCAWLGIASLASCASNKYNGTKLGTKSLVLSLLALLMILVSIA